MIRRVSGALVVAALLLSGIVATTSRAAVTPIFDDRRLEAEVSVLEGETDQASSVPGAPFASWIDGIAVSSFGSCDANGETALFIASAGASQDSFITPVQISVAVSASAQLPDACQLDTSSGYAFSRSEIGFTTDVAYRFIISLIGPFTEPLVELGDISGPSEVLLYDYSGSGQFGYDQVLPPGSYVFRVEARAEEDDSHSDGYAILDFWDVPPPTGAGGVAGVSLSNAGGGDLSFDWPPSCSSDADDYAIYAGDLGMFTSHTSLLCGTSGATSTTITPASGNRYYLVVPLDGSEEGSYGTDSDGLERTVGISACGTQQIGSPCP